MTNRKQHKIFFRLLPLSGSCLFLLLYVIAALYYPGGNYLNKTARGFSWTQNYWCNLLSEKAINGEHNPARPIAFMAMFVLVVTVSLFWYQFPKRAGFTKKQRLALQASGLLSMAIALLIFTDFHDAIIDIAGVFGLISLCGTLIGLKKMGWARLFYMGIFAVVLIGLNNFLYYVDDPMHYLALVQKITFVYFLVWICLIDIYWVRQPLN